MRCPYARRPTLYYNPNIAISCKGSRRGVLCRSVRGGAYSRAVVHSMLTLHVIFHAVEV
ncbi:hypothetical protein BD311DRAFT_766092 [Dichomitus squalens]|uniref:Uncharacterized protein n=1 Tax=Dichomitus squalens TaxID=114155 RepID=A0A4Q9Q7C3_9APHY|nr:hypothetical protein BD311DRAFT_766092 [Dichomitus squalens]TBU63417.1 hypothetical protein BD310DRAFT_578501 [Dichomitus squalens]